MSGGWGSYSIRSCASIGSFKQARNYFSDRKPVRSNRWAMFARPLKSTRETWYKLVRGADEDYYDLVLFEKPYIRYYKPNEINEEVVLLRNKIDRSVWLWLSQHGWDTWAQKMRTVSGVEVCVPLGTADIHEPCRQIPAGWSARLVFVDKLLVLAKSDHREVYTKKSSEADKENRKRFSKNIDTVLDLLSLRVDYFHANAEVSYSRGRAFGSFRTAQGERFSLERLLDDTSDSFELTDEMGKYLLPFAQELYNVSLSKRYYTNIHSWRYGERFSFDKFAEQGISQLPSEQFKKTLRGALLRLSGNDRRSQKVYLPQFPVDLPRVYFVD